MMARTLTRRTIFLHWIIAILVIALWFVGEIVSDLPREAAEQRARLMGMHGSFGLIVLVLGVWRLLNRMREGFPPALANQGALLDLLARIIHWVLLFLPILMPISGMITMASTGRPFLFFGMEIYGGTGERNRGLHELGEVLHDTGGAILLFAIILHVLGALKHAFIDRDGTLFRMLGMR